REARSSIRSPPLLSGVVLCSVLLFSVLTPRGAHGAVYPGHMSERTDAGGAPRIDLHAHSSGPDGRTDVRQLCSPRAAAGPDVPALTHHDTVSGWPELAGAARATGVAAVPAMEVSSEEDGCSVPLLALLVDPSPDTAGAAEMARARR